VFANLEVRKVEVRDKLPAEVGPWLAVVLPFVPVVVLGVRILVGVLEVRVVPCRVVHHEIEQHGHPTFVGRIHERLVILSAAEVLGNREEIRDVVAVRCAVVLEDRRQPQTVDAQLLDMIEPFFERFEGGFGLVVVSCIATHVDLVQFDLSAPLRRFIEPTDRKIAGCGHPTVSDEFATETVDAYGVGHTIALADSDRMNAGLVVDSIEGNAEFAVVDGDIAFGDSVAVVEKELDIDLVSIARRVGMRFHRCSDNRLVADDSTVESDARSTLSLATGFAECGRPRAGTTDAATLERPCGAALAAVAAVSTVSGATGAT